MAEHSAVVFNTLVLHKRRCSNSETEGLPVQSQIPPPKKEKLIRTGLMKIWLAGFID